MGRPRPQRRDVTSQATAVRHVAPSSWGVPGRRVGSARVSIGSDRLPFPRTRVEAPAHTGRPFLGLWGISVKINATNFPAIRRRCESARRRQTTERALLGIRRLVSLREKGRAPLRQLRSMCPSSGPSVVGVPLCMERASAPSRGPSLGSVNMRPFCTQGESS